MARLKNGVYDGLESITRYLSFKYDRTLTISDVITYLALQFINQEKLEIEINPGIWDLKEMEPKPETEGEDKNS